MAVVNNDLLNREQGGDTGDTPTPPDRGERHLSPSSASSIIISGDDDNIAGSSGVVGPLFKLLVGVNAECSLVCRTAAARLTAGLTVRVDIVDESVGDSPQQAEAALSSSAKPSH